jgi:hypothetical protein
MASLVLEDTDNSCSTQRMKRKPIEHAGMVLDTPNMMKVRGVRPQYQFLLVGSTPPRVDWMSLSKQKRLINHACKHHCC